MRRGLSNWVLSLVVFSAPLTLVHCGWGWVAAAYLLLVIVLSALGIVLGGSHA